MSKVNLNSSTNNVYLGNLERETRMQPTSLRVCANDDRHGISQLCRRSGALETVVGENDKDGAESEQ